MAIKKVKLPNNTTEDINDPRLPAVTTTDNGKVLSVSEGIWSADSKPSYTLDEVSDGSTRSLANYLPIDSGVATGASIPLSIKRTSSNSNVYLGYFLGDTTFGYIGFKNQNQPSVRFADWSEYTLYHSGNANKSDVDWACNTLTGTTKVEAPDVFIKSTGYPGLSFADSTQTRWIFSKRGTANHLHIMRYTSSQTYDTVMALEYTYGRVGIGNTSPTEKVDVTGNIKASGTITPGSDSRIKDNQEGISAEYAFEVIGNLKPKSWTWNEDAGENLVGKKAAGLVAQEVKEILPDAVVISKTGKFDDFHSLNYNTVQGYEIAAIKGLIEEVKSLKAEIAELKKQIK